MATVCDQCWWWGARSDMCVGRGGVSVGVGAHAVGCGCAGTSIIGRSPRVLAQEDTVYESKKNVVSQAAARGESARGHLAISTRRWRQCVTTVDGVGRRVMGGPGACVGGRWAWAGRATGVQVWRLSPWLWGCGLCSTRERVKLAETAISNSGTNWIPGASQLGPQDSPRGPF
jgi:hypothetical protein